MRALFILKKNTTYGFNHYCRRSSGLWNSTRFIVEAMKKRGLHVDIVEVTDNNCIDRVVTEHKPQVVILEALWVVPEKFPVLMRLHPTVKWYCHMHSGMPFVALEGISMGWLLAYAAQGVGIIANSPESYDAYRCIFAEAEVVYLPNVYIPAEVPQYKWHEKEYLHVGCFGALRPMKNHLLQALAAIRFAREIGKPLMFHINGSRVEVGGAPVLKCLVQLFEAMPDAKLHQCDWMEPEDFLKHLRKIDIGMQVSMTETFNVVTADYVTAGIPVVVSKEVAWASDWCKALDNSVSDVVRIMHRVYRNRALIALNRWHLKCHSRDSQQAWYEWLRSLA